jgi:hypothetical protein
MPGDLERKHVVLKIDTYERIKKIGKYGDSIDDIVSMLLDTHEGRKDAH